MEIAESTKRESAPGPQEWFSGRAWIEELGVLAAQSPTRVLLVTFEPSARTAWHRHPYGQVLHIVSGTAWAQHDGGQIVELRTGDSVSFAPDERHWHGAAPGSLMSHLAVQATDEELGKETLWEEKVEDAAYLAGAEGSR